LLPISTALIAIKEGSQMAATRDIWAGDGEGEGSPGEEEAEWAALVRGGQTMVPAHSHLFPA